ncbi:hypothetical protein BEL04_06265 [Mucilaginibacter sp. PPCGB 2223]|uniref:FixH family protein n=1 Tax=Mucilaginibacter sp. PPCGB 2223 TaxID=1886027 RepID=UPI0008243EC5|nr:FixH family protein [Mucilaginibacter sp. PPCGB 2223]OCX53887.1 hypothetical protein BEL04_06265 [Mucilaginibacter sp. PPCGB 2223]
MNWGKGIIGGMIAFMLFIIGMGIYMFTVPEDGYDHQYYEKGLSFNNDFNKERQVTIDNARPVITADRQAVALTFTVPAKGVVKFVRPSDAHLDREYEFNTNGDVFLLSRQNIPDGEWQVVIDWKSNNKAYLYQQKFYLK